MRVGHEFVINLGVALEIVLIIAGLSMVIGAELARAWFRRRTRQWEEQLADLDKRAIRIEQHLKIPAGGRGV